MATPSTVAASGAGGGAPPSSSAFSGGSSSELTQTLLAACRADKNAEQQLNAWCQSNFGQLAHALAVEIGAPHRPPEVRQMASVYLKNLLYGKSVQFVREHHDRWSRLDASGRQAIKSALLASFSSGEPGAARHAASPASEIAAIELPYEQWNEFVPTLMAIVTSPTPPAPAAADGSSNGGGGVAVQLAALECLGYTLERLEELERVLPDVPSLSESVVDKILTTIVHGMQPTGASATNADAFRLAAITAFKNSLAFVRKNMSVKSERDFMVRAVCESSQYPGNPQVRQLAYMCMDSMAELYYDALGDYMTVFFQLTTTAIRTGPPPAPSGGGGDAASAFVEHDEDVKKAAIEFWSTIAYTELGLLEEERELREAQLPPVQDRQPCPRYAESAMETLVPLLLETLTKQEEDVEADVWNLQAAGAVCLESISSTVEGKIVPFVIPFVEANITNPDWRMRDAAIVAFASIMDGPDTNMIANFLVQAVPVILSSFQDHVPMVRDSSVHCISKICGLHFAALPPELVQHVVQALISKLQEPSSIAAHACSAIFNIALSCKNPDGTIPDTNFMSSLMYPVLQALLAATDREDSVEGNLRVSAMSAAAELVSTAPRDTHPIFRELMPVVLARMEAAMRIQVVNKEDAEQKEILIGLLCALVTVLFQRLDKSDVLPHVDLCMTLLLQTLGHRLSVDEALLSVGAVAGTMEDDFTKYMPSFMPFLMQGLNSFQDQSLCTVSIGVLVDVCTAVGPKIQPHCDEIMTVLRNVLQDSSVTRDIKPIVISAFGDVAMAIGAAYEPYLQISVMMLMQAAQQSAPADDEDLVAFINSLRLSILEAYSGIIFGLSDGNALHLLVPHVSEILGFLRFLASPQSNRDDDVLHKAVALLGDIAQQMGGQPVVRQQMSQPFVSQLISEALDDPSLRDTASWTQGIVMSVVQQAA